MEYPGRNFAEILKMATEMLSSECLTACFHVCVVIK